MGKTLWVTWEQQRRNKEIADAIGAQYHEIINNTSRIKRYAKCLWQTFKLYNKERPDAVICQNPSFVLALSTILMRSIFRYKVGVDSHNAAFALDTNNVILKRISHFIQKRANFIIAHNDPLKNKVKMYGGNIITLPDRIPKINYNYRVNLDHIYNLLFICTYAKDEPYKELFKAARVISKDVGIYITGKYQGKINPDDYPSNVHFLGRVPWETFDAMLHSVDGIIDLTTREYCLVCGAYESVSVEKPLLLSDTVALKAYFNKGAVYSKNDSESLAVAIQELVANKEQLTKDVKKLKIELQEDWENRKQELLSLIKS